MKSRNYIKFMDRVRLSFSPYKVEVFESADRSEISFITINGYTVKLVDKTFLTVLYNNAFIKVFFLDSYKTQKEMCDEIYKFVLRYETTAEQPTVEETNETTAEQPTVEETNERLTEKYGEDYCIGNMYTYIPSTAFNLCLVRQSKYLADIETYRRYYANPNLYERPSWAKKPTPSKAKLKTYRAVKAMLRESFRYDNTLSRLSDVKSYMNKLYQKDKISDSEYSFYRTKIVDAVYTVSGGWHYVRYQTTASK